MAERRPRHDAWSLLADGGRIRRDERLERPLDWALCKRLFGLMSAYRLRRNFLFALVFTRSVQLPLLAAIPPLILKGPVAEGDVPGLLLAVGGMGLLALLTQATMFFRVRLAHELGEAVVRDLRGAVYAKLMILPMSFYDATKVGRVISRMTSDSENIKAGVQDVLFVAIVQLGQMLVAAGIMFWFDPVLFLAVIGMAPILYLINRTFRKKLSRTHRIIQESFSRVTSTLAESVSGIRITQGFSRQRINADLFHNLVEDHSEFNMDASRVSGTFMPLLELNNQLFTAILILFGGWRAWHGYTSIENVVGFLFLLGVFFGPVAHMGTLYTRLIMSLAGAERVFRLLDLPVPHPDDELPAGLGKIRGEVEFDDVTFAYHEGNPVLHEVSFRAEPGQLVALVGHTGSGKSSIINLITKFHTPTRGTVRIDGRDIMAIRGTELHRQMGLVLQVNFLFTGTVMDNIRFGRPEATDEEVRQVLDHLGCRDVLEVLPEGLATRVGERGGTISLGQRQLICIARAMLADPRIMILDEATSSVDTLTEIRIQHALQKLLRGRTSFVVAHRLSTIREADQVLVLDQGRIVERGVHAELLAHAGVYARLYHQFTRAGEAEGGGD